MNIIRKRDLVFILQTVNANAEFSFTVKIKVKITIDVNKNRTKADKYVHTSYRVQNIICNDDDYNRHIVQK